MVARTGQSRTVGSRDLGKILNSGPKHGSARFIRPEIRTTNRTKKPDTRWTKFFCVEKSEPPRFDDRTGRRFSDLLQPRLMD